MRRRNLKTLVAARILVALVITALLSGQSALAFEDNDFQFWSRAGVSFDLTKDWKADFAEEFRFGNDGGRLYHHFSDLGLVYRSAADWMNLGFNYRQVFEKDSAAEWKQENRPHVNVTLKARLFDMDLSNRSRFEYRDRDHKDDIWVYRNKMSVRLPFELTQLRLQPYVADEVFIIIGNEGYSRNRLYSGVSCNLGKNANLDVYYLRQSTKCQTSWMDLNILGIALKYKF